MTAQDQPTPEPSQTNDPAGSEPTTGDARVPREDAVDAIAARLDGGLDADVQAEVSAAMGEMDQAMSAAMGGGVAHDPRPETTGEHKIRGPRVVQAGREHRKGAVVSVGDADIFIEFGPKELGVIERRAWKEGEEPPKVGEEVEVVVDRYERSENIYLCSRPGQVQKADWEMLQPGQVVEARCTGTNKGGLEMEVAGHRAFMPASQIDVSRVTDMSVYVGEKIECKVTRMDRRGAGNIVLSRREIVQAERAKMAEQLKESLAEGQTLQGVVKKIMPFGAFVDIGGVDGLVHLSDLTHDRVGMGEKAVAKYVKEGEAVQVQVLKLDWDQNRISLGMKQLQDDPFATATEEITEGAEVTGRVKNITDFGVFVELSNGVEGLVHISELDWKRVDDANTVVKADEVITVKVLKVDPESRKISLSLKQMKEAPERPKRDDKGGPGRGQGRGRGRRGEGERDTRTPDEILKETPMLRRMREQARAKSGGGGLTRTKTFDEDLETVSPADTQNEHKPQKKPAKKRETAMPKVEGLDGLLDKFGSQF